MEGTSVETTGGEIDGKFEGTAEVDGAFVLNDGLLVEDGALVETVVEGALLEVGDFVDEDGALVEEKEVKAVVFRSKSLNASFGACRCRAIFLFITRILFPTFKPYDKSDDMAYKIEESNLVYIQYLPSTSV